MSIPDRVVRIELISYFNLYPDTIATSAEMACRLKHSPKQVDHQMKDLVELGILEERNKGEHTLYAYIAPMSLSLMQRKGCSWSGKDAGAVFPVSGGLKEKKRTERERHSGEGGLEESETAFRMRLA